MTPQPTGLTVRRAILEDAVRRLTPLALRVLVHLLVRVCPATGRVWTTRSRLAEELALTAALTTHALDALRDEQFVDHRPSRSGAVLCVEIGEVLVRDEGAPGNLPVAPA